MPVDLGDDGFAYVGIRNSLGSPLTDMLLASEILPGTAPGYALCKTIYSYHPLGAILVDAPIKRAQAAPREIKIPVLGEKQLVEQFTEEWNRTSGIGGTALVANLFSISRMYGIGSIAVGGDTDDTAAPFDTAGVAERDLFFNILDPLNTAGSLVLDQDPNSAMFLKTGGGLVVNGKGYHPSRVITQMHEQPLYIEWTTSAYGFVGRSVYQRALYPLKSFVQTMATDQMIAQKAGLLVAKMKQPGSVINKLMQGMFGAKRSELKAGVTGQVLSVGETESIESIDLKNIDGAGKFARDNIIKNIASAAGMPASIVMQETLTEGFGEGTEDAKKENAYLDSLRSEMAPAYAFLDKIVMRRAWTPAFFKTLQSIYPEYRNMPYETALQGWMREFKAIWPNLNTEPDSEKVKTQEIQFKSVVALVEVLAPLLDPKGKAEVIAWAAANVNEQENLFASKLNLDEDELESYLIDAEEQKKEMLAAGAAAQGEGAEPAKPRPFSNAA